MSDVVVPSTYNEPTLIWRMRRADGRRAQAVIDPRGAGARVVWLVNDRPLGLRDFDDWASAIRWTDQLKTHYRAVGWRVSDEVEPGPTR